MWRIAWRTFRALGGLQHWAQRRFTPAGLFLIGAATLAAALGVDTNQSLAYKIFTALVALLAVAWVAGRFERGRFEVRRELPRAVAAGESFDYRVRVRNVGERRVEGARLLEDLGDPRPSFALFRSEARRPTYAQWWWVMERHRVAGVGEPELPPLAPGEEAEIRARVRTYRRGRVHLGSCTVALAEPLGLVRRGVRVAVQDHVLVVPRRYRVPALGLPGTRRYQAGGVSLSSSVGDSEECIGLRDYRPGDAMQRIHWKSYARRGLPVVREFQDEYFQRHALVLDTFCAGAAEAAFEEAVAVAASLAQAIDTQPAWRPAATSHSASCTRRCARSVRRCPARSWCWWRGTRRGGRSSTRCAPRGWRCAWWS